MADALEWDGTPGVYRVSVGHDGIDKFCCFIAQSASRLVMSENGVDVHMPPLIGTTQTESLRTAHLYSLNPLVGCIDDFLPKRTVDEITDALSTVALKAAKVGSLEGAVVGENRKTKSFTVLPQTMPLIDELQDRIAALFRLKPSLCEHPEFISYEKGDEFKRHFDGALSGSMSGTLDDKKASSQRIFTGVLYLNHDFSGGTTVFPRLGIELQPKLGRLAFWQNTRPANAKAHPDSMHQGCEVTDGNKRILSFWFRDRPWETLHKG